MKIILRIIVLPLVVVTTFIFSMWQLMEWWGNFVIYGGGFIALNKNRSKKTIAETYDKLQEFLSEGKK